METQNPSGSPVGIQEFWQRILALIGNNHKGYVRKSEVEEKLSIHFSHIEKDGDRRNLGSEYFYEFNNEIYGIGQVKIGLYEDKTFSLLNVDWFQRQQYAMGQENDPAVALENRHPHLDYGVEPNCLMVNGVLRDLGKLGWETKGNSIPVGEYSRVLFMSGDPAPPEIVGTTKPYISVTSPSESSSCVVALSIRSRSN
ncbi:hypothetical protein N5B55_03090 [Ralstonia pickettii]|uniref:hypothetical protein n=1 Tax=Ralstonia pickettii TaxID=329 RepID=UPI0027144B54|nr:hypothetical protein [Ralstonia pickettii]WKZ85958.1 hypothetical protein N5B55_03090 [Ralstonia pickettii]